MQSANLPSMTTAGTERTPSPLARLATAASFMSRMLILASLGNKADRTMLQPPTQEDLADSYLSRRGETLASIFLTFAGKFDRKRKVCLGYPDSLN